MEKTPEVIGWVFQQSGVVIVLLICGWMLWQKFLPMLQVQQEKYETSLESQIKDARDQRTRDAERQSLDFQTALDKITHAHEFANERIISKLNEISAAVRGNEK